MSASCYDAAVQAIARSCHFALLTAFAAALGACRSDPSQADAGPDAGADGGVRAHPAPGPGQAAAWQVADQHDLIGGPSTAGRVGDWMMANSRVRFVIEGPHASDGYDPYGCAPIAADRQRPAGTPGESRFGEMVLLFNFRGASCDALELVSDGSDDGTAALRATGRDALLPTAASLFTDGTEPPALHARIFRDYSLAPDADALHLTLTVQNDGDAPLHLDKLYAAMAMNRGLRHWVPGSGFDFADLSAVNPRAEFYAAVGERVSYSLYNLDSPYSPIVDFAKILFGQYAAVTIPPGQAHAYRFLIGVGSGDVGSLQSAHAQALGAAAGTVSLRGSVVGPAGEAVAGARVHVTDPAGAQAASFLRTAADGSFAGTLPAAGYAVRAVASDRATGAQQSLVLGNLGLTGVRLTLGAASRIDVNAAGLPVKVVAEPVATGRPKLPAALGEPWDFQPVIAFPETGHASLAVFPGQWRVTVSRGFEYDLARGVVTAPAGGAVPFAAALTRVVDTTGWMSGDFHVHAQGSIDGNDLFTEKVRAFAAEGVEIPVSTEHEFIGDFGPAVAQLGLSNFLHSIAGTELTTTFIGHFNIFPLAPNLAAVNNGAFDWYGRPVPQVIAEARLRTINGAAPIVQMNHPRTLGMAYLDALQFDPVSFTVQANPTHFMKEWDAMEVWNGAPLYRFEGCLGDAACAAIAPIGLQPTAADWFGFLDRGLGVTGTGNSDSHTASLNEVGYPRTYLRVGVDDPATLTDARVTAALRTQAAIISGGPFLLPSAADHTQRMVGPGEVALADRTSGSPVVHLHLEVQAPTWMGPLSRVDIWRGDTSAVMGGKLVLSLDLTQGPYQDTGASVRRLSTTVDVPTPRDTWLVVTVRGADPHALWPVVQASVPPFAISNPIWVDADGDGKVTPLK